MTRRRDWLIAGFVVVFLLALIGLGMTGLGMTGPPKVRERVGEVNVWPAIAASGRQERPPQWTFPFKFNDQAEVLLSGLDDVRGLACTDQAVYIAEGNGAVLKYTDDVPSPDPVLYDDHPVHIDIRGIAIAGHSLLLADFGRGIVVERPEPPDGRGEFIISGRELSGPSGIAVGPDNSLVVTDARPWPGAGTNGTFETADYARWLDKGSPRLFGALGESAPPAAGVVHSWTVADLPLRHPSGIASLGGDGPLYVAEADDTEVRWPVLERESGAWVQRRALGTAPVEGRKLAKFLGVALSPQGRFVFGAGPKGLYVFSHESMLGWMAFAEPVSGVAACGKRLYLAVGHRLCAIRVCELP